MSEKTKQLVDSLKTWCDGGRGRRAEVARFLETKPQTITNWFGGRQNPTSEQALAVLEFLKKQKRNK
jgi:hypothetical protein